MDGLLAFPSETKVLVPPNAIRPASDRQTPPPQLPRTALHDIRHAFSPFLFGVMVGLGCVALLVPTSPRTTRLAAPTGGTPIAAAALAPATPPSPAPAATPVVVAPPRPGAQTPSQDPAVPLVNPVVPPVRRIQTDFRGSLEVGSSPQGAQVFLNGVPVGTTPVVLRDLPVGSRALRVELDGYKHWSSTVQIMASEQARIMATLPESLTP